MPPPVAALDAGRLWNRTRFHLEQAWFGYGDQRRAARTALAALGRAARCLVPAAERRAFQERVTGPIGALLDRTESEAHHDFYEDWTGEFVDADLTDGDFRRALAPAFEALAAVRRVIEEKLDQPALLAFHLGERLDQGACPPDLFAHRGRPRPTHDRYEPSPQAAPARLKRGMKLKSHDRVAAEDGPFDYPFAPGDVRPAAGWDLDVQQHLAELAVSLGLAPDALLLERGQCHDPVVNVIGWIDEKVGTALATWPEPGPDRAVGRHRVEEPCLTGPPEGRRTTDPPPHVPRSGSADPEDSGAELGGTGPTVQTTRGRDRLAWDAKTDARHKWVYDKCCDPGLQLTEILAEFKAVALKERWPLVGSINGIKHVANAYAKRHGLGPPPSRKGG